MLEILIRGIPHRVYVARGKIKADIPANGKNTSTVEKNLTL